MLYTVVGADEVKDVVQLIKALDPHVFINIINSEGVTGDFIKNLSNKKRKVYIDFVFLYKSSFFYFGTIL